jgi:phytoene synthase
MNAPITARAELGGAASGGLADADALLALANGSKTFAFAGWFLPAERRIDAARLYAFCRYVDDLADDAPDLETARVSLARVRAELRGEATAGPIVAALVDLLTRCRVDIGIAEALVDGVASDLQEVRLADDAALLRYGYRVASTVGLMMCGVLGVDNDEAGPFAVDLGIAMQITNICRDVAEDARRGRVYLPRTRLQAAGVGFEPSDVLAHPEGVRRVVLDLLSLADRYYASADHGMRFIPARARLAILIASRTYRAIGTVLRARAGDALAGRVFVPLGRKLWMAFDGVVAWARASGWRTAHRAELHRCLHDLPGCHAPRGSS